MIFRSCKACLQAGSLQSDDGEENSSERKLQLLHSDVLKKKHSTAQALQTTKRISLQLYCQSNQWHTHW